MKAKDFDRKFDEGKEDIVDDLDLSAARRVNQEHKRINVDFPVWVVESLDREAARIGVTRQSIIKVWLVERLKAETANVLINDATESGNLQRRRFENESNASGMLSLQQQSPSGMKSRGAFLYVGDSIAVDIGGAVTDSG